MCHQVTCDSCGKPTWSGCGQHIEQALAGVPGDQRCRCKRETPPSNPSLLQRLFGR